MQASNLALASEKNWCNFNKINRLFRQIAIRAGEKNPNFAASINDTHLVCEKVW